MLEYDSPLSATSSRYHLVTDANGVDRDEATFRFSRMANMITTRSDVFEILVTVQAGYGVDEDGNGQINYRSSNEFIVTAEKKTRTVYER